MTAEQYKIQEIKRLEVSDDLLHRYFTFSDILQKEFDPDEPELPLDLRTKYFRDEHPHFGNRSWWMTTEEDGNLIIVGAANYGYTKEEAPTYESNKHIINMGIRVHPNYRRQGLATRLLKLIVENSTELEGITTVFTGSYLDAGKEFCTINGGIFSQEGAENRLQIGQVDWEMIDQWIEQGEHRGKSEGVTIQFFEDCPEDIIEEYVNIYTETMNQQPLGEYDGEIIVTADTRRLDEKRNEEKGMKWFTMISRERDGTISGLTEIFYHPDLNYKAFQNLTGVKAEYRGRSLGKWLKAKMLRWFIEEHSFIKYITTGNDDTNAPMLSINNRMGFEKFISSVSYKFEYEDLKSKVLGD